MKKIIFLAIALGTIFFLILHFQTEKSSSVDQVLKQYQADLAALHQEVQLLQELVRADRGEAIQQQFLRSREAYKKTEWLAEYYNSYTAKQINGPALREVEADQKEVIIYPEGFQVIEELLFPEMRHEEKKNLLHQVGVLQSNIKRLRLQAASLETTDAHVFDALRLQVFRVISLGISGFDSPLAKNSIAEAASCFKAIETYSLFYQEAVKRKNPALQKLLRDRLQSAHEYLKHAPGFFEFDRAEFIMAYANPVSKVLLLTQQQLSIPVFSEPRALAASAPTLFSPEIFNANFYTPGIKSYSDSAKVHLGKQLFHDVILSGNNAVSCATCHQPDKGFSDGLEKSFTIDGKTHVKRNAPTLINAALQPALFYDTRAAYLEDQANEVILNKDEMHGSFEQTLGMIKNHPGYTEKFERAFGKVPITAYHINNALASYLRSLVSLNSNFDLYMRGHPEKMTKEEVKGFNLFMGKAKCGTCHFVPLFNGSNPPVFNKSEAEVIGVPSTADTTRTTIDSDVGKFVLYKVPLHKHAFKTPGLRNIALTAPYMHNGVYKTLEDVIAFYNRGGGGGMGFEMENITLPKERLNLTAVEKKALISFLHTLTDTAGIH